jgi:hypothetical protein
MSISVNAGGFGSSSVSKIFGVSTESFEAAQGLDPNLASEIPRILSAFSSVDLKGKLTTEDLNKIDHHLRMLENKLRTSDSPNAGLLGEVADQLEEVRKTHEPDCRCATEGTPIDGDAKKIKESITLLMGMSKSIDTLDELASVMAMMSVCGAYLNTSQLNTISQNITDFAKEGLQKLESPEQKAEFLSTVIKMVESSSVDLDTSELEDLLEDVEKEIVDKATQTEETSQGQEERTSDFIVTGAPETFAGVGTHLLESKSGAGAGAASATGIDPQLGQTGPRAVSLSELVFGTLKLQQSPLQIQPLHQAKHDDAYWIAEVEKPGNAWLNEARGELGKKFAEGLFDGVNEQMQLLAEALTEATINNFPGLEGIELI